MWKNLKSIEEGNYFIRFSAARILLGIVFISLPIFLFAQTAPPIEWQNTIGGTKSDNLTKIIINSNGNYIVGGTSMSDSSFDKTQNSFGDDDYWLMELNQTGQIIWQCSYGGDFIDGLTSIVQTTDLGYLVGGYSNSGISGNKTDSSRGSADYFILKTDSLGNIQWQKTIGGAYSDQLFDLIQLNDGGFMLGGSSDSEPPGEKTDSSRGASDYWIVKLFSTGIIEWQKTIGGNSLDLLRFIRETNDGGFLMGGESMSDSSGDRTEYSRGFFDYWIVRIDSIGNIIWQKAYGGNDYDAPVAMELTPDKGFITTGNSSSSISGDKSENSRGDADYWIIKADSIGNIQWQKTIGGISGDLPNALTLTTDGGYLIGGNSDSDSSWEKSENSRGLADYWVIKIDSMGNIQWQKTIGGIGLDLLYSMQKTVDNGYLLGGLSGSQISGEKTEMNYGGFDYWIVKLSGPLGIAQLQLEKKQFRFFPNPAIDVLTVEPISGTQGKYRLSMTDMPGRQKIIMEFTGSLSLNLKDLDAGIYIATITEQGKIIQTEKVVILK